MIYIAAHKKFNVPQLDNYAVLQVGAQGKENLGYLQDNTGDNISYKNPNFCELTGLYWIWKNCDDEYNIEGSDLVDQLVFLSRHQDSQRNRKDVGKDHCNDTDGKGIADL